MKIVASIILATALCTGTLYAAKPEHAGKNKSKQHKKDKHHKKQKNKKHKKQFSSREQGAVHSYYRSLPPGLAKKLRRGKQLPPGWQNKVSVGQPIPKEYLVYAKPVPRELELQLSAGPIGSKVLQLADRVVRIEAGTNMVLDAIRF